MRILLVEADSSHSRLIELALAGEGFKVDATDLGEDAVSIAKVDDYDAILLALDPPDMSGFEVLRQLRSARVHAPVMILGAGQVFETEVKALAAGADDFIAKPYRKDILVERLRAIIRRAKGLSAPAITVGDLVIDLSTRTARVGSNIVRLTNREYAMLECLALHKGRMMTKALLLSHLYGGRDEPEIKIIDVFVCKVRRKLRPFGAHRLIETSWGQGYRLTDTPAEPAYEPSVQPPTTAQQTILARLQAGPASFLQIWNEFPTAPEGTVRNAIAGLVYRGEVERIGEPRMATYQLVRQVGAAA